MSGFAKRDHLGLVNVLVRGKHAQNRDFTQMRVIASLCGVQYTQTHMLYFTMDSVFAILAST